MSSGPPFLLLPRTRSSACLWHQHIPTQYQEQHIAHAQALPGTPFFSAKFHLSSSLCTEQHQTGCHDVQKIPAIALTLIRMIRYTRLEALCPSRWSTELELQRNPAWQRRIDPSSILRSSKAASRPPRAHLPVSSFRLRFNRAKTTCPDPTQVVHPASTCD